ncbi:hypothetical protein NLI96_g11105 [Meripilus lineatus]|uniref:DNA endonuclease activator Ctp1 C-terminal domain-containing protein n=1 Tax=Meripilus lineatus TaxID=2056292 RepID=A0AAD5UTZ3_9APHY|nr:hypothetical protein NLI96_g11105 [Physisporinus lineatus]
MPLDSAALATRRAPTHPAPTSLFLTESIDTPARMSSTTNSSSFSQDEIIDALRAELIEQERINGLARKAVEQCLIDIKKEKGNNRKLLAEIAQLRAGKEAVSQITSSDMDKGLEEVRSSDINSGQDETSSLLRLESELRQLQIRYDALLEEKQVADRRFESHYRKCKNFKSWLMRGERCVPSNKKITTGVKRRVHRMRQHLVQSSSSRQLSEDTSEEVHGGRSVSILNIVKSDENALPLRNTEASVSDKLDAVDDIIIDHSDSSSNEQSRAVQGRTSRAAALYDTKRTLLNNNQELGSGRTPPGYWNIGFPDTQEVAIINNQINVV